MAESRGLEALINRGSSLNRYSLKIGNTVKELRGALDPQQGKGTLRTDDSPVQVFFEPLGSNCYRIVIDGRLYKVWVDRQANAKHVFVNGSAFTVEHATPSHPASARRSTIDEGPGEVTPPMPSVVARVLVKEGEQVEKGQGLVVVTAMKMETTLKAPYAGTVTKINTEPEAKVMPGDILVEIEPEEGGHE